MNGTFANSRFHQAVNRVFPLTNTETDTETDKKWVGFCVNKFITICDRLCVGQCKLTVISASQYIRFNDRICVSVVSQSYLL